MAITMHHTLLTLASQTNSEIETKARVVNVWTLCQNGMWSVNSSISMHPLTYAVNESITVEPVYSGRYLGQRLLPVIERWPNYTCIFQ